MSGLDYMGLPRTREEAKAVGSVRYKTGRECLHGHVCPRYTSSGSCYACALATSKAALAAKRRNAGMRQINQQLSVDGRWQADARGILTYTCLLPCRKGHFERYTSCGKCIKCTKEQAKARRGAKKAAAKK